MAQFSFETTPRIVCRQGAALQLAEQVRQFGAGRVLFVTDPGLVKAGVAQAPVKALEEAGLFVRVFSDIEADPPEHCVLAAVAAAREANIDCVIGFGGGSAMDAAKLVALMTCSQQTLPELYGVGKATSKRLPLIQVPTTAGTGSEATPTAVVSTPSQEKRGVISPQLYPDVAVLDSLLTLGLPPAMTAMTGIDAMVHAIEAYTSRHRKNPMSDMLAVKALQLLLANLPIVIARGDDADARENMLTGSLFAGMAFANSPVAAVHALASPLGAHFHVPHGLANSLVLSPVLRFNMASARAQYAQLGRALLNGHVDSADDVAAEAFVSTMEALVRAMPIPHTLREVGVGEADLPLLAQGAMGMERLLINNPREVRYEDALALYQATF
jgi:alcohol dehydrogenase class IV